ncbi:MAG: MATE family efflux transporter [Chloroflexota bacterium]|nr:MATE family efflux transporter [Chloroflexota bacterium]
MGAQQSQQDHPFVRAPHATLFTLTVPVLVSMVAEPLTGLVDTAFVARLGTVPLAALGVGATALSSVFWIFNFLQIGTQTEVAKLFGRHDRARASAISGLALVLSVLFGVLLIGAVVPNAAWIAAGMGAHGALQADAASYIRIRAFGAPAVLLMLAAFGALRGLQAMTIPLYVAVTVNLLNIVLDAALIFGFGPIPALGVAGAALASVASQWIGAIWAVGAVLQRLGLPRGLCVSDAGKLLLVGGDLFVRTGLLTGFTVLTMRLATSVGSEVGAAHQAIRQVWLFTALFLDAFAVTGQSMVGYFLGAHQVAQARRVAAVVCAWSLGTGLALGLLMIAGREAIEALLAPPTVRGRFTSAWIVAALVQPLNALSFATDGIHWGTGDYRYLRNAMLIATVTAGAVLVPINSTALDTLTYIWLVTGLWSGIRATLGIARVWPGIWNAPLALRIKEAV